MVQTHQNQPSSSRPGGRLEKISSATIDHWSTDSDSDQSTSTKPADSLELTSEAQLKIIEQTGILNQLRTSSVDQKYSLSSKNQSSSSSPAKRKPLIEFSTKDLKQIKSQLASENEDQKTEETHQVPTADTLPLWVDRAFDTFLWSIPFNTIFICLDVAIHAQYGQPVTLSLELNRLKNVYPTSLFIIHYSIHHQEEIFSKLLLFTLSTIGGSYMIYAMNKLSYLLVLKRVPSLGALWMFSVVRMHLTHCVFSLLLVSLWCWIMNLSLYV